MLVTLEHYSRYSALRAMYRALEHYYSTTVQLKMIIIKVKVNPPPILQLLAVFCSGIGKTEVFRVTYGGEGDYNRGAVLGGGGVIVVKKGLAKAQPSAYSPVIQGS